MDNTQTKGYIFLCSDGTEQECSTKLLFGGTEKYQSKIKKVNIGDILFLYNYKSQKLYGPFTAISESGLNLISDAWNGRFPWQVKVKKQTDYRFLTRVDFEDFIGFHKGMPEAKIIPEQLEKLLDKFKSTDRLPPQERDYRDENPADKWTIDRHKVRSKAEVQIENWLFAHNIAHGTEIEVAYEGETMFCDFFINSQKPNEYIYIEYWGLEEESYQERRQHKLGIYKRGNFKLIELLLEDLKNLDDILPKKLRLHLPDLKFI